MVQVLQGMLNSACFFSCKSNILVGSIDCAALCRSTFETRMVNSVWTQLAHLTGQAAENRSILWSTSEHFLPAQPTIDSGLLGPRNLDLFDFRNLQNTLNFIEYMGHGQFTGRENNMGRIWRSSQRSRLSVRGVEVGARRCARQTAFGQTPHQGRETAPGILIDCRYLR